MSKKIQISTIVYQSSRIPKLTQEIGRKKKKKKVGKHHKDASHKEQVAKESRGNVNKCPLTCISNALKCLLDHRLKKKKPTTPFL